MASEKTFDRTPSDRPTWSGRAMETPDAVVSTSRTSRAAVRYVARQLILSTWIAALTRA